MVAMLTSMLLAPICLVINQHPILLISSRIVDIALPHRYMCIPICTFGLLLPAETAPGRHTPPLPLSPTDSIRF